ncbi:hypothetical protein ACH419_32730 [Streptomyces bobili]|uniref:hypothetical protein n=1 Tax=Streptomyces bobili TaxID=67280 RepID=UPI0037A20D7B
MAASVPPRLIGPRMAVWGYFPFDGRTVDAAGTVADWAWAMRQWDQVAAAGGAVRLVVADQPYSRFDIGTAIGKQRRAEALGRFAACRAAEQLVFGRVYVAGGKLAIGTVDAAPLDDPLNPGRKVAAVAGQIDAWRRLYADGIDGIFLDSGPVDCADPARPGSDPSIPFNYRDYALAVDDPGYKLFVQAAQYPDTQSPIGWLHDLRADFLELWEAGVLPYRSRFQARDACRPGSDPGVPNWWDPGEALRWSRVHVINDCRDADTMRAVADLAVRERGAGTVWITRSRQDPTFGAVFDVLPPYWDAEVEVFREFLRRDEERAKQEKDSKDDKDASDKSAKDSKDGKDGKDEKDDKDSKEAADKPPKDTKDGKDDKDDKDAKDDPDNKPPKDQKDDKDEKDPKDHKEVKEDKDAKDKEDKDAKDNEGILKDSETAFKAFEVAGLPAVPEPEEDPSGPASEPEAVEPEQLGRTFIRDSERPAVGSTIVADPEPGEEEAGHEQR